MGNKEVSPAIIIAAVVVLVVVLGYFGWRAMTPPQPPPGSYTPGVPPWMDKNSHAPSGGIPPGPGQPPH